MKLALPKGRLLSDTSTLLERAGIELSDYDERLRSYRPRSTNFPNLFLKVFQEKDIPIQVAIGNYDLGICGLDWVEEFLVKYPSGDLVKVRDLGYGKSDLYVVASRYAGVSSVGEINNGFERVRIVSEYQNLAELFALRLRLRRFSILPIWGAAEVYPPESADLALIAETSVGSFANYNLVALARILTSKAFLVANRNSLAKADMSELLTHLRAPEVEASEEQPLPVITGEKVEKGEKSGKIRLALPDGHQQHPTTEFLKRAGVNIRGYSEALETRRPTPELAGVSVKVIRPQDMPIQVANENFDLAITGKDWLKDHLYRFPSSPVREILSLGFGKVSIVAVVSRDLPVNDVYELRDLVKGGLLPIIRVASEYVNIADKYARDNHLERYKIIPTWGASEAFLPEDADLLIENTQTGETLSRHNLRIIDTLFESAACLIGNKDTLSHPSKKAKIDHIIKIMEETVGKGF
ncbi:MAG: ATP phosphoribosyltransferase [Dehalococcoidia bacterium]|nr:ATP phosphoribosyltransferase [Dehalococcoidia bacterium]